MVEATVQQVTERKETIDSDSPPLIVIDDHPDVKVLFERYLFGIYTSIPWHDNCNGLAVRLITEGVPLRIISDIQMSGTNGNTFITELFGLCTQHGFPLPKVLFISGLRESVIVSLIEPIRTAFSEAEISFLVKPVKAEDIREFATG